MRRTCTAPRCSADGEAAWRNAIAELAPRSCAEAGHEARTVFVAPRIGALTTTLNSACDGLIEALYAVRARPPPPEVGMQPRNGRKLEVAALGGTRAAWKTTLRRVVTPGPTGLPVSPRNQTSTSAVATRASVPATTYPLNGQASS